MADFVRSKLPTRFSRSPIHRTTIKDLPDPIVAEILSRLPTKSIFISRFVCKLWNYLTTTDSYFSKLHFSRSHLEFLVQIKNELNMGVANWIEPDFDMTQGFKTHVTVKPRTEIPYTNNGMIGSCCGLVLCLNKGRNSDLGVICNPLTGEYLTLPICDKGNTLGDEKKWYEIEDTKWAQEFREMVEEMGGLKGDAIYRFNAYAFGYCAKTNCFKVLRIFSEDKDSLWMDSGTAEINVVGSDLWRGIGSAPFCPSATSQPILLNEVVHWMCDDNKVKKFIVYLDFESERFGEFEPPFGIEKNFQKRKHRMTVSVLGGCLAVCDVLRMGKFDIWVMKEYGAQESWSKDFTVDATVVDMFLQGRHRPLKVLSNGEILMLSLGDARRYPKFVCYDPEDNAVRMLKLLCFDKFEVVAHTPSFIPLKDVILGDDLNVQNFKDVVTNISHGRVRPLPDPSWVGIWRTWRSLFIVEHCYATVDEYQKLPD